MRGEFLPPGGLLVMANFVGAEGAWTAHPG
jgi:hypothetical protein